MTNDFQKNIIGGRNNTEIFTIKQYAIYEEKYIINKDKVEEESIGFQRINNPHDKIFRKLLDKKEEAIEIINSQLKNKISTEDIEHYNSSYVTDSLRNSEADVIYKLKGREVFFLIEHQAYIDYSMPYRILKYEIEIMESSLIGRKYREKDYKYPLVIPIVIYTGHEEWKPEMDIRKIQEKFDKYEGLELSKYNVYNINKIEEDELLKGKRMINKIFMIEKSRSKEELINNLNKITDKELREEEKKLLSIIVEKVFNGILGEEITKEIIEKIRKGGEKNMLAVIDMLKREKQEIEEEMEERMRKGIKEGIKEGIKKAKIEDIKNMIKENLSVEQISRITGMKKEDIEKIIV